jgi:hypothetical protein
MLWIHPVDRFDQSRGKRTVDLAAQMAAPDGRLG